MRSNLFLTTVGCVTLALSACGDDSSGGSGDSGNSAASSTPGQTGLPSGQAIDSLTAEDRVSFCEWAANQPGVGEEMDCGGGVTVVVEVDVEDCKMALSSGDCDVTIAEAEACFEAQLESCDFVLPECDELLACPRGAASPSGGDGDGDAEIPGGDCGTVIDGVPSAVDADYADTTLFGDAEVDIGGVVRLPECVPAGTAFQIGFARDNFPGSPWVGNEIAIDATRSSTDAIRYLLQDASAGEYIVFVVVDRNGDGEVGSGDWGGYAGGTVDAPVQTPQEAARIAVAAGAPVEISFGINLIE